MKRLLACFFLILFCFSGTIAGTGSSAMQTAGHKGSGSGQSGYISAVQSDLFVSAKPQLPVFSAKTEPGPGIKSQADAYVCRQNLGFRLQLAMRVLIGLSLPVIKSRQAKLMFPFHGFW